jgi:hypothetical protein
MELSGLDDEEFLAMAMPGKTSIKAKSTITIGRICFFMAALYLSVTITGIRPVPDVQSANALPITEPSLGSVEAIA